MTPDLSAAVWRKSSRSGGNGGACVEIANTGAIRDSKNPAGPALLVDPSGLVAALKAGTIDNTTRPPMARSSGTTACPTNRPRIRTARTRRRGRLPCPNGLSFEDKPSYPDPDLSTSLAASFEAY